MRVIIQDCTTLLYLAPGDLWTADHVEASSFKDTTVALRVCMLHRDKNLQIVLKFDPPAKDVKLPLKGSDC